eukprot:c10492_g1_i1.p2 GENE.c10492_g1_i1~~c10492_g1_i1.p2  ORF type:complete len:199 (+),score=47.82 c10492_g1_i1:79-675(+)
MSSHIIWNCIKNHSSYLLKSHGAAFSREPGNVSNRNEHRYSGLAHKRTLHVSSVGKNQIALRIRRTKKTLERKPTKVVKTFLMKKGQAKVLRTIKGITKNYRSDIQHMALARATALLRFQRLRRRGTERPEKRPRHVSRAMAKKARSVWCQDNKKARAALKGTPRKEKVAKKETPKAAPAPAKAAPAKEKKQAQPKKN